MSVQFNTLMLEHDGNAWNINAAYTVCGWVNVPNNTDDTFFFGIANGSTSGNEDRFGSDGLGHFYAEVTSASTLGSTPTDPGTFTGGTWYFVSFRRTSSTACNLFVNDSVVANGASFDVSARLAPDRWCFGRSIDVGTYMTGQMTQFRIWPSALTDTQLRTERDSPTIQLPGGTEIANYPMTNAANATDDISANNYDTFENVGTAATGASNPTQPFGGGSGGLMWL